MLSEFREHTSFTHGAGPWVIPQIGDILSTTQGFELVNGWHWTEQDFSYLEQILI
jgi:hypothetical protein